MYQTAESSPGLNAVLSMSSLKGMHTLFVLSIDGHVELEEVADNLEDVGNDGNAYVVIDINPSDQSCPTLFNHLDSHEEFFEPNARDRQKIVDEIAIQHEGVCQGGVIWLMSAIDLSTVDNIHEGLMVLG